MRAVVLYMRDGSAVRLDRNCRLEDIAAIINEARVCMNPRLLEFDDDKTPSTNVWIDPSEVVRMEER